MISIVYLLTSKWHEVNDEALIATGLIDIGITFIIVSAVF